LLRATFGSHKLVTPAVFERQPPPDLLRWRQRPARGRCPGPGQQVCASSSNSRQARPRHACRQRTPAAAVNDKPDCATTTDAKHDFDTAVLRPTAARLLNSDQDFTAALRVRPRHGCSRHNSTESTSCSPRPTAVQLTSATTGARLVQPHGCSNRPPLAPLRARPRHGYRPEYDLRTSCSPRPTAAQLPSATT